MRNIQDMIKIIMIIMDIITVIHIIIRKNLEKKRQVKNISPKNYIVKILDIKIKSMILSIQIQLI